MSVLNLQPVYVHARIHKQLPQLKTISASRRSICNAIPTGIGTLHESYTQDPQYFREAVKPEIVVIIVKKRITARFFMEAKRGFFENPTPGTIIDNTVTSLQW